VSITERIIQIIQDVLDSPILGLRNRNLFRLCCIHLSIVTPDTKNDGGRFVIKHHIVIRPKGRNRLILNVETGLHVGYKIETILAMSSIFQIGMESMEKDTLIAELRSVLKELSEIPTTYSQSNPSYILAYRYLRKKQQTLEAELLKRKKED
jgi:hypothetical protein